MALFAVVVAALMFYINYVFTSLINNSSIVLELYRLEELNIYSIVAYASYAMLFVALLCAVGAFLGGVEDKQRFIRNAVNRIFPPKE